MPLEFWVQARVVGLDNACHGRIAEFAISEGLFDRKNELNSCDEAH